MFCLCLPAFYPHLASLFLWYCSSVDVNWITQPYRREHRPDSKVHGTNMGPTWVLSAPDGPHVGPMNLAIRAELLQPSPKERSHHVQELEADTISHLRSLIVRSCTIVRFCIQMLVSICHLAGSRQQCCRDACQISEQLENPSHRYRALETLRDLKTFYAILHRPLNI